MNPPPGPGPKDRLSGATALSPQLVTPALGQAPGPRPPPVCPARHRGFPERRLDPNPAPRGKPCSRGDLTLPGPGVLGWAVGELAAASQPGASGPGPGPGRQWAPGLRWMGGQPPLPSWHLEGGAALGWWGPREGRGPLPGCARCHPQAAHRKGAPGGPFPAPPQPVPAPRPAELWPGPGPSSCGAWLSGTGKTCCAHTFPGPPVPSGWRPREKGALHAWRCTPRSLPPSDPHDGGGDAV